jgi:putative phage-type endonuclease
MVSPLLVYDINGIDFTPPSQEQIAARYTFPESSWQDCDTYWLNTAAQCTKEWEDNRMNRLTASSFGTATGRSLFETTPLQLGMQITGLKESHFTHKAQFLMTHGVQTEPVARTWYERIKDVKVEEVGLAVPKYEPRIGASADGVVSGTDGCIEIKCPKRMYAPLTRHMSRIRSGWQPPMYYHEHIWESHYAQMQGVMHVLGKTWCDYVVYATDSNNAFIDRIPYNADYWKNELWPDINFFLNTVLEPLIAYGYDSPHFRSC